MKAKIILYLALVVFASSCAPSLSPFTQDIYDEYRFSEKELKHVQFFLSRDIVLFKEIKKGTKIIDGGKIKIRNGREVEEIVFKKGTPGVLIFLPKDDRFAVSFEETDDRYLIFGPNPRADDRYVLLAKDWNRQTGKVSYDNDIYQTSSESAYAALMVDLKKISQASYKTKVAEGRKIN